MRRTVTRLTAAVAAALALTTVLAAPASAVTVVVGNNAARNPAYDCIQALDGEADGRGVYANAVFKDGSNWVAWDGNGADGKWGEWTCVETVPIYRMRVCEDSAPGWDNDWCSDWVWPNSRTGRQVGISGG